jgi:hypothetical protein
LGVGVEGEGELTFLIDALTSCLREGKRVESTEGYGQRELLIGDRRLRWLINNTAYGSSDLDYIDIPIVNCRGDDKSSSSWSKHDEGWKSSAV